MNLICLTIALTAFIMPMDNKEEIGNALSEKLIRMGYSQEEINEFSQEKLKRFNNLTLFESVSIVTTMNDTEELIQVGAN